MAQPLIAAIYQQFMGSLKIAAIVKESIIGDMFKKP